jgi:hypothetical protein
VLPEEGPPQKRFQNLQRSGGTRIDLNGDGETFPLFSDEDKIHGVEATKEKRLGQNLRHPPEERLRARRLSSRSEGKRRHVAAPDKGFPSELLPSDQLFRTSHRNGAPSVREKGETPRKARKKFLEDVSPEQNLPPPEANSRAGSAPPGLYEPPSSACHSSFLSGEEHLRRREVRLPQNLS